MNIDCACSCELESHQRRDLYEVVGHDESIAFCLYCVGCYELAQDDWNGVTAEIREVARDPMPAHQWPAWDAMIEKNDATCSTVLISFWSPTLDTAIEYANRTTAGDDVRRIEVYAR